MPILYYIFLSASLNHPFVKDFILFNSILSSYQLKKAGIQRISALIPQITSLSKLKSL